MRNRTKSAGIGLGWLLAGLALPQPAAAFCGFYVAGADTKLYANATMVVMMRDGTRTVLSIQNNYQGPPEAFALVVPVPTVLQKDQVKVLPKDVFGHVDALGAPRLVEYWEDDPCRIYADEDGAKASGPVATRASSAPGAGSVKVEAMFAVGEYDVVILSAQDSSGLETWLHDNHYNIPNGAGDVLAPYVASGTKFFVAKVDPQRVTFQDGQAALSPLRFHYDSQDFSLPVRLGLLNSQGTQDLIVNILARDRYEVANHPNLTVPTNIRVQNGVRDAFGGFYEALFAQTLAKNPGAVVTEYAWTASTCDPCPTEPLSQSDLATLGADVTSEVAANTGPQSFVNYTLTRLHYRYTQETLGDDLVFKQAPAIMGGRGVPDEKGALEGTVDANTGVNNFQGRYVILHAWDKAIECQKPVRGRWGAQSGQGGAPGTLTAMNTALVGKPAAKAADLSALVAESVPSIGVTAKAPSDPLADHKGGCSLTQAQTARAWPALLLGLGALGFSWRKRRR